jgi:transcriptional antiterminator NusG
MGEKDNEKLDPDSQQELEVEGDPTPEEEASAIVEPDTSVEDTDPGEETRAEIATPSHTPEDALDQENAMTASEEPVSVEEISEGEPQIEEVSAKADTSSEDEVTAEDEISTEEEVSPVVVDEAIEQGAREIEEPEAEVLAEETEIVAEVEPPSAEEEAEDVVSVEESVSVEEVSAEGEGKLDQEMATAPARIEEPDDGRLWYVVHCYSGYENKVRHNLEQRIETMGMKAKIFDVVVPTEEEIEIKDGKRRTVERRVFPGYILVQMIMDEDSWYVVRNTPGVTGFVGMGNEPTPLRPEEVSQIVKRMEAEAPRIKVTYKLGQKVRIIDGPFNDFIGTVSDIDMERAKVRVMVSFFGRETPVELDFLQVEKA